MQSSKDNRNLATVLVLAVIAFSCGSQSWAQGPWSQQDSPTTTDLESVFFVDANNGWIAAENGRILHTSNGGSSWQLQDTPFGTRDLESIFFIDTNRGWAVGDSGHILDTSNGGTSWNLQPTGTFTFLDLKSVFFIDANTGWAAGKSGTILKTTDGGGQWAKSSTQDILMDFNSIFFVDANNGWAVGAGHPRIVRTTDGGVTWTGQSLPPNFEAFLESVFFVDANNGWAVGQFAILRTFNGGTTWVSQQFDPSTPLNSVSATSTNNAWAVGDSGRIFRTTDGGSQWVLEETPIFNELESVFFVGQKGWAVAEEGRILVRPASPVTPTVLAANFLNGDNSILSSRVYLFNPSTTAGEVTVHAFSLPPRDGFNQSTASPLSLGTLGARSALNIKVVEDILIPLGITPPYTPDGGNLTLEFTILAPGVKGAGQVFSPDFAFGTYPLREIPATSAGIPTVLVANIMNGNDAAFNSEVYLFNPSTSDGAVAVRVFTLPLKDGTAKELTVTPLALGILGARSALSIKVGPDILTPLDISRPYMTDGGNLVLEFTVEAGDVRGAAQVFTSDFAFGTYPLEVIPSPSAGSPTVLAVNFMNGNDAAFNSRVYLFNPSQSAGAVTVRVYTLPLKDGTAQELTAGPMDLGILGARSALNLRLVEDILTPSLITTPYTTDGGNLTLEFTIQSANVRGAAQVFSSSFAYGTLLLQSIPATSAGIPTVLVANFLNGNNAAFSSRVYLFNPSASPGDVTVRAFTLPLLGGTAQELGTPLNLGSLAARSALNIKVVEDILTPLGITTPYTDNGGNLTLEFSIQAADVVGASQVFSPSFAYGTMPMQVIE